MKKSFGAQTLLYPTPVLVVGTYDKNGKPNVMTVAWGGICSSRPPSVAISLREATYSHGNIVERKAFTVNIPGEGQLAAADFFGMASGKTVDKLAVTGLTPVKSDLVDAPYVKEFPVVLECRLTHTVEVGLHTHFIGEILDVKADDSVLGVDGAPSIEKVAPMIYVPGAQVYYSTGKALGKAFSVGKAFK